VPVEASLEGGPERRGPLQQIGLYSGHGVCEVSHRGKRTRGERAQKRGTSGKTGIGRGAREKRGIKRNTEVC